MDLQTFQQWILAFLMIFITGMDMFWNLYDTRCMSGVEIHVWKARSRGGLVIRSKLRARAAAFGQFETGNVTLWILIGRSMLRVWPKPKFDLTF